MFITSLCWVESSKKEIGTNMTMTNVTITIITTRIDLQEKITKLFSKTGLI